MRKLELTQMEKVNGEGKIGIFISGLACGYGLATAATGVGVVVAIVGCTAFFL